MKFSLGKNFPLKLRRNSFDRLIHKGAVFRVFIPWIAPPKPKRFVVWGVYKERGQFALSFINTEINPNVLPTEELQRLQLLLQSEGRPYLDNDSHLDCADIKEKKIQWLKREFGENPRIHLGEMSPEDISKAEEKIIRARTIKPKLKKRYGFIR
ncbi:MAG: hypothetical protein JRI22_12705 [Deltaproteobacteria bacterium]|nr:hypothetical protein [Deltaproteobacteria bacterium]